MSAGTAPRGTAAPAELVDAVRSDDWAKARALLEQDGGPPSGPLPDAGPALLAEALWRLRCGVRPREQEERRVTEERARERALQATREGNEAPQSPKLTHPWKKQRGLIRRLIGGGVPGLGAAVLALDWCWPSRTPWALTDEELARWVDVVGAAPRCDASTLALLQLAFRTRIRTQWRPAAAALGALAARDPAVARPAVLALLAPSTARPTPKSHPDQAEREAALAAWEGTRAAREAEWGNAPHDRRHALTTLAAWHAADPEGAEAHAPLSKLLEGPVPADASDRSAALLALATLADRPDRAEACLRRAATLVDGRPADPQTAEALVELVLAVPDALRERALELTRRAVARGGEAPAGAATDWAWARAVVVDSLARHAPERLEAFVDEEPELAPWLLLRLVGADRLAEGSALLARAREAWEWLRLDRLREGSQRASAAREALEARLRALNDRPGWDLLDPVGRALLVGEAFELATSAAELVELRWELLAERAGWPTTGSHARAGRAGDVAGDAIVLALDRLGVRQLPEHLVRSARLSVDEALELAARGHGFLDTQLALAFERALRRATLDEADPALPGDPDDPERARLLFRLLQRRPAPRLVEELAVLSRDPKLRAATRALLDCLTYIREAPTPPPVVEALERVDAMLRALWSPLAGARDVFAALDQLRKQLDGLTKPGLEERFLALSNLLPAPAVGSGPETVTGLLIWLDPSSTEAGAAHAAATRAVTAYRRLGGIADVASLVAWRDEVSSALAALAELTRCLPEPNAFVLGSLLTPLGRQLDLLDGHLGPLRDPPGQDLDGLARLQEAASSVRTWLVRNRVEGRHREAIERSMLRVVRAGADAALHSTLEEADEAEVVGLLTRPERTLLFEHASEPLLVALRSWLYDRHLVGAAWLLVRQPEVRRRGVAGGVFSHFSPVFFGVPVGTLQVAQLSDHLAAFAAGGTVRLVVTSAILVGLILAYMAWDLLDRPVTWARLGSLTVPEGPVAAVPARVERALWAVGRPFPLFVVALVQSVATSWLYLWLFVDKPWEPSLLVVWTALTLFVGVFVGLIAAGRRMGGR